MRFLVRYKCQNCGEIFKDKLTINHQPKQKILDELTRESEKTVIHSCAYQSWGVAKPYVFKIDWGDYDD